MRSGQLSAWATAAVALLAASGGFLLALFYLGHWQAHWDDRIDWGAILNLAGGLINASAILIAAWVITDRLQRRQTGRDFERALLADFTKQALRSTDQVHDRLLNCRRQNTYTEEDRQAFILLLTSLGQDIQLIQDTLASVERSASVAETAQTCRSQYKDLLTDRAPGVVFSHEDERSAILKYREMRKTLVQVIVDVNRS